MGWFKRAFKAVTSFGLSEVDEALRAAQRKYKAREYNHYINIYTTTNTTYALNIPHELLHTSADKYADLKAKQAYPTISGVVSEMFNSKNIGKTILNIVLAIVGIVLSIFAPPAGWVMVSSVVASVIGTITSFTLQVRGLQTEKMLALKSMEISSVSGATSLAQQARKTQSQQITQLLIHNPYEMFPEGSLYKKDRAGSIGYQAGLEAPNPMRAINGTYTENALAKQITNTAHKSLAGNVGYNPTPLPYPTQDFKQDPQKVLENIQSQFKTHALQIQNGFKTLAENYFCFDNVKAFNEHFNRNMEERVNPRILNFNSYMFLEQNTYYQKGERLPCFISKKLPSQLKAQGLPSFHDSPLVLYQGISYEVGQELLEYKVSEWVDKGEYGETYCKVSFYNASRLFRGKRDFKTEEGFVQKPSTKAAYERWLYNATSPIMSEIREKINMVFVLDNNGQIANSTYALKNEVSGLLENKQLSTNLVSVVESGRYYGVLVARKHSEPFTQETSTSTLKDLKETLQDITNVDVDSTPFWQCYDLELLAYTDKGKEVPALAQEMARKYHIQGDDFTLYAVNKEILEQYHYDFNALPQEVSKTNALFYSLIGFLARQKEGQEV